MHRCPFPFKTILTVFCLTLCMTAGGGSADERDVGGFDRVDRHPAVSAFDVAPDRLPAELFLVRARGPLPQVAGVVVHGARGDTYLVSGDTRTVMSLAALGCSVAPVQPAPAIETSSRRWVEIDEPVAAVAEMVAEVEWDGIEEIVDWLVGFGTRFSFARNHRQVAESIRDRFSAIGLEPTMREFTFQGKKMWNVEATHTGVVAPDSFIVICGHFDSISERAQFNAPGADDNASGIAAVMTAAQILSRHEFGYSIRFLCFAGEEQLLRGSQAYAEWARANDLPIIGVLNYDMIGWWEPGVVRNLEIETNVASQWLATAIVNATRLYTDTPYKLHVFDGAWWGDHASFWSQGYPAVNHEESWDWNDPDFNPHYHSTQDLPEYLHPEFTVDNVKVAVASLATLAGFVPPILRVSFDFRPGPTPGPFNPRSNGVTPALLHGSPGFDVHAVDLASLQLEGVAPKTIRVRDESGDGLADLSMKFPTADIAAAIGVVTRRDTVRVHLSGALADGTLIAGDDLVRIAGNTGGPQKNDATAHETRLGSATPNPFNPTTRIAFTLARSSRVRLTVFDARGRIVENLVNEVRPAGPNHAGWNAGNRPSGIYFYRLEADGMVQTRKLVLLK